MQDLELAEKLAKEALEKIKADREEYAGEAINWGDFGVVSVWRPIQVSIEEASSPKVANFVFDYLVAGGFSPNDLDVRTDW